MTAADGFSSVAEALDRVHSHVLEMIAAGAPLGETLEALVRLVEHASTNGMLGSILVVDPEGRRLRHGAAPSLPDQYNSAIEGVVIGPEVGSCGTAAFLGQPVVVSDIASDPRWKDFRDLASRFGLKACWSTPIFGSDRAVIGTFANYYREVRDPSPEDRGLTQLITRTAAIAIEHDRRRARLELQMRRLQRLYSLTETLGRSRGLSHLYEEGMSAVQDLLGVRRASILLFDDDGVMRFKAWRGLSEGYRRAVEGHSPWKPGDTTARPIVVPDVAADPALAPYRDVFVRERIAGLGFFPLRSLRVLGKFMAYFDEPRELSDEEIGAADTVAHHVAVAVERARQEDSLHRAHSILRGLFEQTADVVFVKDRDGRYVMVNSAAASVAGITTEEMVGRTAGEVFPAPVGEAIMRRDESIMTAGVTQTLEEPIVSHGEPRTFLSTKGAWRDAAGSVIGLIGISRDITDRKRHEEELRRKARQQAAIAEFGVLALSDAARDLLGDRAASLALELMEAEYSMVGELVPGSQELGERWSAGPPDAGLRPLCSRLASLALQDRGAAVVYDFAADPRFAELGVSGRGIAVAVRGPDKVLGVIATVAAAPRAIPPDDVYCMLSLANVLGMGIERRSMFEASRESEERFRSLSACSPTGIFLTDTQGACRYTNASCRTICGFGEDDWRGSGWLDFVFHEDRERVGRAWSEAALAGRGFTDILRFQHRGGAVRWTHVRTAPVVGDRSQLLGHVGTVEDITETRAMTDALRTSEARYRSLVTATAQVVWRADAEGMIGDMPDWRALTGQSVDEVRGTGWFDAVHPDDQGALLEATRRAAESCTPLEHEFRLRMKDGTYRYMLDRAVPVLGDDGSVREWVGTCSDIDERRHGVEAIALLSEAGAVLGSSLVLEEMLARLGRLLLARGVDLCAIAVGEAGAMTLRHVARSERAGPAPDPDVLRQLLTRRDEAALPALGFHSGRILPLMARSRVIGALLIASAEPGRHCPRDRAVAEELAGRVALAVDNAALYAEAQLASRAKDEFLATLSHELRTPMTAILGWTRMLQMGEVDAETHRAALESIEHSTRAQAQMVEDILDVSRIITGKMLIEPRVMQLCAVIEEALRAVRPAAEAKGISVIVDLPATRRKMRGDPNRLQQVVWNLVSNAIKFTPPGGRVTVRASCESGGVTLTVADTGEGIPRELIPHVFERFRQADGSSTRAHGGLGLGLAIARHLVELHGGVITAESDGPGRGAVFTVRLPLGDRGRTRAAREAPVRAPAAARLPSLRRTRILVVDDEAQTRGFVASLLQRCGAEVRVSSSVQEALTALDAWSPHVVVSDLAMPSEDGYELMTRLRLRERPGRPPVAIALTAFGRPEDRDRALAAGFAHFVQKPIDPVEFARLVAAAKSSRRPGARKAE